MQQVVGLDVAPLAVDMCNQLLNERMATTMPKQLAKIQVMVQDFFEFAPGPDRLFDFVFDYTFLCALQPHLRSPWSESMHALVRPGGLLMTLIFPIGDYEGGPPFAVSVELYQSLLSSGFTLIHGPCVSEKTVKSRQGRELVAVWQRHTNSSV